MVSELWPSCWFSFILSPLFRVNLESIKNNKKIAVLCVLVRHLLVSLNSFTLSFHFVSISSLSFWFVNFRLGSLSFILFIHLIFELLFVSCFVRICVRVRVVFNYSTLWVLGFVFGNLSFFGVMIHQFLC